MLPPVLHGLAVSVAALHGFTALLVMVHFVVSVTLLAKCWAFIPSGLMASPAVATVVYGLSCVVRVLLFLGGPWLIFPHLVLYTVYTRCVLFWSSQCFSVLLSHFVDLTYLDGFD